MVSASVRNCRSPPAVGGLSSALFAVALQHAHHERRGDGGAAAIGRAGQASKLLVRCRVGGACGGQRSRRKPLGRTVLNLDRVPHARARNANEVWDLDNLIKPTLDAMEDAFGFRAWKGPAQAADDRVDHLEASKRTVSAGEAPGAPAR